MTFAVPFTCYVHDRQDADYIAQYVMSYQPRSQRLAALRKDLESTR